MKNLKNYFPVLLLLVFAFECCNTNKENKSENKAYTIAFKKASESPIKETKFFLGFKVGMTENDYVQHLKDLCAQNKLYKYDETAPDNSAEITEPSEISNEFGLQYDLEIAQDSVYHIRLTPIYVKNKLYYMIYKIIAYKNSKDKTPYKTVANYFRKTAKGHQFKEFITKDNNGDEIYTFIKDNLGVIFDSFNGGEMSYINIPDMKIAEKENKEEKKETSKEF
jgi:hypothetical protein